MSQSERRNTDLFFADLMGGGAPRSSLSRSDAESFFEEFVGRTSSLRESFEDDPAPKVTPGANADEIVVTRADGTKFRVRRRIRTQILTRPGRPRLGFCSDDERVFFRLAWCEGTQGTIDAGANPQGAFKALLDKVMDQISKGESPEQIKRTFEKAPLEVFLKVDITKVGQWKITGDVKLEMNRSGIASTTATVSADRGWFKVGAEFKTDGEGKQVMVTLEIPLERRKIQGKKCPVRELVVWWEAECLREVPITIPIDPLLKYIEKTEKLYLYFDYAKDTLRRDSKVRPTGPVDEITEILRSDPKIGTARLNKRQLELLDYFAGQGYWVTTVNGYASPEGRRTPPGPKDRGLAAKWEGNDALSRARAEKVSKLIEARYPVTIVLRPTPGQRTPAMPKPTAVGLSERPKLDNRLGGELEGNALDRAIIDGDEKLKVKPFLEQHPDELKRMTDEDQKFVMDKSKTPRLRAERLFENLRRVEIHLLKHEPVRPGSFTTTTFEHVNNCPKDLVEAAERKWGSRIPFFKKDAPICN